jgi:hypothetical protein
MTYISHVERKGTQMRMMKNFLDWLDEVREITRYRFDEYCETYSFENAYASGYSPRRAADEAAGRMKLAA